MNKVTLIGNVTRNLELKPYSNGEGNYVRFTLAVNDFKSKIKENSTLFIDIIAFGKKAEMLSKYISKGRKLAVDGRINTGSYFNNQGEKRYSTEVVLEDFYFVDSKRENVG